MAKSRRKAPSARAQSSLCAALDPEGSGGGRIVDQGHIFDNVGWFKVKEKELADISLLLDENGDVDSIHEYDRIINIHVYERYVCRYCGAGEFSYRVLNYRLVDMLAEEGVFPDNLVGLEDGS